MLMKNFLRSIAAIFFLAANILPALSASSSLSNLSAASSVASTDLFYDVQTAGTGGVKATGAQVLTFIETGLTMTGQIITPIGSLGSYAVQIGPSTDAGIFATTAGNFDVGANGAFIFRVSNGSGVTLESGSALNWSNTGGNPAATKDTGLSRGSAGVVDVGNGTAADTSGTLVATTLTGTLSTAAQTNITSVGTLSSLALSGGISGATTIAASGIISTSSAGTAANPEITVGNSTTGLYSASTTGFGESVHGTLEADFGITNSGAWTFAGGIYGTLDTAAQTNITSVGTLTSLATGTITISADAILSAPASATLQLGAADASSPVAQTLQVQNVVGGTSSTAGAAWTLQGSLSTGSGAAGLPSIKTGFAGVTGAQTVTISNASPAVITLAAHGYVPGENGQFTTSGSLPTGLSTSTTYYVIAAGLASGTFEISATPGGSAINTSSAGSGTQTWTPNTTVQNPASTVVAIGPSGLTGSQTTSAFAITQTQNTSGNPTVLSVSAVDIAVGATSTALLLNLQGGSSGTTSEFKVDFSGDASALGSITSTGVTGISQNANTNGAAINPFKNSSSGSSATEVIEFGNSTSSTEATLTLNSSANTGGNGDNSFTITAAAGMWLQGEGTNALGFGASGAMTIYNQPTTGTIAYGVCAAANANGSGGGALILDSSATVCGLSSMAFKKDIAAFDTHGMIRLASLDPIEGNLAPAPAGVDPMEILKLSPASFIGDGKTFTYTKPSFAIMAQDACDVDERICARFADGSPRTPIPEALMALQVGFDQVEDAKVVALQVEVAQLKAQVESLHQ
jgi:hypothetical protein